MKQHKNLQNNLPPGFINFLIELKTQFELDWVCIFGSRARGDHNERSDIDIAASAPDLNDSDWAKLDDALQQNPLTLLKIDLTRFDRLQDSSFKSRIQKEGIKI